MPVPAALLRVHHAGDWPADQVRTSWVPSTFAPPPEAARAIDDAWARATAEPNRTLFDGPMCRMESWAVVGRPGATPGATPDPSPSRSGAGSAGAGPAVVCSFSRTSYRAFWGTNIGHPEWADRYGPAAMANPVGVSPALETADGYLLFGRRNAEVAYYPSRVHPFAGAVEPDDRVSADDHAPGGHAPGGQASGGPDLFAAVRRELREELRLADADLDLVRLTGVVEDVRLRQPELIFRVKTNLPRARVEAQLDREEHHHAVAVPATEAGVGAALADPAVTPVGLASLLLWGRLAFGTRWFGEHAP